MRFLKSKSALVLQSGFLSLGVLLACSLQPALAETKTKNSKDKNSTDIGLIAQDGSQAQNLPSPAGSGRAKQIAVAIPGVGEAKIVVTPAPTVAKAGKPLVQSGLPSGSNISVKLPRSGDQALDDLSEVGKRSKEGAFQLYQEMNKILHWIGVYLKQHFHTPELTPGAYPYVQNKELNPGSFAHKIVYGRDGRIKTIVQR